MRQRVATYLTLAVCVGAMAVVVTRAATLAVTHDEAFTYNTFLAGPWTDVLKGHSNNHPLFTWLAAATTAAFGPGPLALRLPSVLAAAAYLAAAARLARRVAGEWGWVVLALLSFNPLVLDYLVAARGYGLALAGLMGAVWFAVSAADGDGRRRCRRSGVCGGLAVAANLTFAVPVAVLLVAAAVRLRGRVRRPWLHLLAPAALAGGAVLWPYLIQISRGQFYLGYPHPTDTVVDLYAASFHHDATAPTNRAEVDARRPLAVWGRADGAGVAVVLAAVAVAVVRGHRDLRPYAVLLAVPAGSVAGIVAMRLVLGTPWPVARTAVYLLPLGTLAAAVVVGRSASSAAAAAVVLAAYAVQLPLRALHYDRYDAGDERALAAIAADVANDPRPVRVAATWIYVPSLNYYRTVHGADRWLAPVEFTEQAAPAGFDYFVYHPADYPQAVVAPLTPLYEDPVSGLRVGRVSRPPAAGR